MKRPIIGITLDSEEAGGWSPMPWYALRQNYCSVIARHGGLPFTLPHEPDCVKEYIETIDGLLITGGHFDISPTLYGVKEKHAKTSPKEKRTAFEFAITKAAMAKKKPILGICGGEQLINVILGGTLVQHIPDSVPDALEHEQKNPRTQASHSIAIKEGTLLHRITGTKKMSVNSSHHQAVATPGKDVIINCTAPDGVVEGIESTRHPFCLGVEWHPEYEVDKGDTKIIQAFIRACRRR
jgi:putative glutamine amidotransferase